MNTSEADYGSGNPYETPNEPYMKVLIPNLLHGYLKYFRSPSNSGLMLSEDAI